MSIVSGKVTPSIGKTFSKTHIISTGIPIYLIIVHVDVFCFQMENILITPVAYTVFVYMCCYIEPIKLEKNFN